MCGNGYLFGNLLSFLGRSGNGVEVVFLIYFLSYGDYYIYKVSIFGLRGIVSGVVSMIEVY